MWISVVPVVLHVVCWTEMSAWSIWLRRGSRAKASVIYGVEGTSRGARFSRV